MAGYDKETLIDRIIYTASLVSRAQEVDAYLDKLRTITARTDFSPSHMSNQEYDILSGLQHQLEAYLVERETLRSFTPESLQIQIEQHLAGNRGAKEGLLEVGIILAITVAALAALAVPSTQELQQRFVFMGAVAAGIMNLGGAWLFIGALPAFTSQLRRAFIFICVGVMIFALAILLQPFIELWGLRSTSDVQVFFVMPLILVASLLIYLGAARYARMVGVESRFLSLKTLATLALVITVGAVLVPHHAGSSSALALAVSAALHGGVILFALATTVVLAKIVSRVADLYKPPLRALLQAILFLLGTVLFLASTVASAGPRLSTAIAFTAFAVLLLTGGMLVRAGYAFKKIGRY